MIKITYRYNTKRYKDSGDENLTSLGDVDTHSFLIN